MNVFYEKFMDCLAGSKTAFEVYEGRDFCSVKLPAYSEKRKPVDVTVLFQDSSASISISGIVHVDRIDESILQKVNLFNSENRWPKCFILDDKSISDSEEIFFMNEDDVVPYTMLSILRVLDSADDIYSKLTGIE